MKRKLLYITGTQSYDSKMDLALKTDENCYFLQLDETLTDELFDEYPTIAVIDNSFNIFKAKLIKRLVKDLQFEFIKINLNNMKNTLKQDLKAPLHEVQRSWIRKPVTVLLTVVLFGPALFLGICIAFGRLHEEMTTYFSAARHTYKGLKK